MRYGRAVVERVLDELGVEYEETNSEWAEAFCPLHDDVNKKSFTVHLSEGAWRCYSGCGSDGDLAKLVEALTGEKAADARARLRRGLVADDSVLRQVLDEIEPLPPIEDAPADPDLTYERGRIPKYMIRRGFTVDTLRDWEVGWDAELGAVVIPVTRDGVLVGLVRRPLKYVEGQGKYLNTRGLSKNNTLLGLDHTGFGVQEVVLVEGPMDAMWLYQHGRQAVASLGASLSSAQADLIAARFWVVWLAYDEDPAGRAAVRRAAALLRQRRVELLRVRLPAGRKDIQECSAEELESAFAHRIPWGLPVR